MKKIVIIGGTGFVGSEIVKEALSRDMKVKTIVRNPEKVIEKSSNLEIVKVDILDEDKLAELLKGEEIVVSAYNPGWTNPSIYEDTLKGYKSIINTVKKVGVKRLLVVGGAGSLFVKPGLKLMDSGQIPEDLLPGVKGLAEVYANILKEEKELDWIFFSPASDLAEGQRTGSYRLGKDDLIVDNKGESKISVQDYAKAMIDEVVNQQHSKERFTIGY